MAKGEVLRSLRMPQLARDPENGRAVITLNGEEDQFIVLQMDRSVADDLATKLIRAGYGETR